MTQKTTKLTLAVISALVLAALLAVGCGVGAASTPSEQAEAGPAKEEEAPRAGNFAGRVEGTDAFVAVVVDGEEYVGGWILLSSGEQRGAVKNRSTGFMDPLGDLARPS